MNQLHVKEVETCLFSRDKNYISNLVVDSYKKIAPFWPLKNLIAVNPLQGLENLPFEEALKIGAAYFQQNDLPQEMQKVNRETIKWLQAYCDDGQATIHMPLRKNGLYHTWRRLAFYDQKLHKHNQQSRQWLSMLPETPEQAIEECLLRLNVEEEKHEQFLTLLLTTLPGWAAYIKYCAEFSRLNTYNSHPITKSDYMAVRIIIASLLWPHAKTLLDWHRRALKKSQISHIEKIQSAEKFYRLALLKELSTQSIHAPHVPEAQLVFCIDVRSEPFRRQLELIGDYQTLGFAGFFGVPVKISNAVTGDSYDSCPVLLKPKHDVEISPCSRTEIEYHQKSYKRLTLFKQLYQSVKYNLTTPFALVEMLGVFSGLWMGLRSLSPMLASKIKTFIINAIHTPMPTAPSLANITFSEQCAYAEGVLRMMGVTDHFASVVVFCGHGSTTQNNAYASALDCGACGGRHGLNNARILAAILNQVEVKEHLASKGIFIPKATLFIAAEHNTTTDEVHLCDEEDSPQVRKLKEDLVKARQANNSLRIKKIEKNKTILNTTSNIYLRAHDWAQVRPEWGLARNSAFIIGPRDITSSLNLEGRCFLHSYDYQQDPKGSNLATILTAPMVVAQWINMQYLFSTLDNIAYGGGSKITKNITGKIGVMQGNASDLMTGLPLQSVYCNDADAYHELQRLMTVIFAPRDTIDKIILQEILLQKLFGNSWVQIAVIEPDSRRVYLLNKDFSWREIN